MGKNNARMPDLNTIIQAGINPKTGLPIKMGDPAALKNNIKKLIRIVDEQNAIRRYTWHNLPSGLTGDLLERILYYKGQAAFFYMPTNNKFYFLPYTLKGTIDCYGRFTGITPMAFMGSTGTGDKEKPFIQGLVRTPIYEFPLVPDADMFENGCVLLSDYCKQLSQTNIARQILNDPLLDVMSDCIPYLHTALKNSTGVEGMRVSDETEASNVYAANDSINHAALTGEQFVPIIGNVDFQALTNGATGKTEEFMLAMQSLDNFRLGLYGIQNGGLFEKKAHLLQEESAINNTKVNQIYQDGLTLRQDFCDYVNAIWGLGIWCDASETVIGDTDLDGKGYDNEDQSGEAEGQQPIPHNVEVTE